MLRIILRLNLINFLPLSRVVTSNKGFKTFQTRKCYEEKNCLEQEILHAGEGLQVWTVFFMWVYECEIREDMCEAKTAFRT